MIETKDLILRKILETDDKDIFEYSKLDDVGPNAGWKPHESLEETHEIMKQLFLAYDFSFAIVLKKTNKLIGTIGLIPDPKREYEQSKMLGYSLHSGYKGNGYMTQAATALVKFAFEKTDTQIVSAYCYPFNKASQHIIEKCGLKYEGTLRKCEMRYDGVLLDNLCYSVDKDEFNKIKERNL